MELGPFHILLHGDHRYLCYSSRGGSSFNVFVTDASEMWSTDFTEEKLEEYKHKSGMSASENYSEKIREALGRSPTSLVLQDSRVILKIKDDSWNSTFDLYKLPLSESRVRLQTLMFDLVDQVTNLEKRLKAADGADASCSPGKNSLSSQRLLIPDLDFRKISRGGSAKVSKRIPGESLINPGFKSKKAASGVDFEDS